jgi:hypothetical protein
MGIDIRYDNPAAAWGIDDHGQQVVPGLTAVQAAVHERLVARHRRVATPSVSSCMACGVSWPCEVGQSLEIIESLLQA